MQKLSAGRTVLLEAELSETTQKPRADYAVADAISSANG